jgi:hypothetical protein
VSLGVAIKGPEGIVLAADSRVTLEARPANTNIVLPVFYDNATKLLSFSKQPNVGAVTYGQAVIGMRTAHSLLPEFEVGLEAKRLSVAAFAEKLSEFFLDRWKASMPKDYSGPQLTFIVAGFDEGAAYGEIHLFEIPGNPRPKVRTAKDGFGMTWGGQLDIVSRIVSGYDPSLAHLLAKESEQPQEVVEKWLSNVQPAVQLVVPFEFLALQDCVNLATAVIRTTMVFQDTAVRMRGVGGPIDIAVIRRTGGLQFIQRKALAGEMGYAVQEAADRERT